jgi:acyl-coenzyme A thioesterase PaaI-like protein
MNQILEAYKSVGNEAFTKMVIDAAPYFGTVDPMFVDLRPGYVEAKLPNTKKVHNHMGTVHAIAMCNAAELVGGMMTEVSIPDSNRWIPVEMTVRYLKMAKTDLRVVASGSDIDWTVLGYIKVPIHIYDTGETEVFSADITMKISKKKRQDP